MHDHAPLAATLRDHFLQASTATVATQLFRLGLRNTFLNGLLPLNPAHSRFVGEAATLRFIPMREDLDTIETIHDPNYPQRLAIESARPGAVLVVDSRGDPRAGTVGNILVTRLRVRGAAAFVTDGAVRDAPEIAAQPFPVFAAARSGAISLSVHHAVDFDVPIACAGVAVYPDDILLGDEEGVVVIPRHLAEVIAEPAAAQEALERFLLAKIEAGASLPGTYPPNEQTLAEYAAWSRSNHDQPGTGRR